MTSTTGAIETIHCCHKHLQLPTGAIHYPVIRNTKCRRLKRGHYSDDQENTKVATYQRQIIHISASGEQLANNRGLPSSDRRDQCRFTYALAEGAEGSLKIARNRTGNRQRKQHSRRTRLPTVLTSIPPLSRVRTMLTSPHLLATLRMVAVLSCNGQTTYVSEKC